MILRCRNLLKLFFQCFSMFCQLFEVLMITQIWRVKNRFYILHHELEIVEHWISYKRLFFLIPKLCNKKAVFALSNQPKCNMIIFYIYSSWSISRLMLYLPYLFKIFYFWFNLAYFSVWVCFIRHGPCWRVYQ